MATDYCAACGGEWHDHICPGEDSTPTPARSEAAGGSEADHTVTVKRDGSLFCALCGPNLQEGIAGFGPTISDALHALADVWFTREPGRSEAAGGEEVALANVCIYCGCDLDGGSTVGSCEHVSVREREVAWQKKWAAAVDQSGANALHAVRAEDAAASLRQQLAAAREDAERLDWLEKCGVSGEYGYNLVIRFRADRASIDRERAKQVAWREERARTEPAREGEGGDDA